jgi:hypothetical protein
MAKLENGGEAVVENGRLMTAMLKKRDDDDEGRAMVVSDEVDVKEYPLDYVEDVSFSRATRLDLHGALVVKMKDGTEVVLKLREEDALPMVALLRAQPDVQHRTDGDSGGSNDVNE